jgi:hypothetical protein
MTTKRRPRKGRKPHTDDPPMPFATTLSESTIKTLNDLHETIGRPRSEIIKKALQLYAEMHHLLKP